MTPKIGGVTENTTHPSNPAIISIKPTIFGVIYAITTNTVAMTPLYM